LKGSETQASLEFSDTGNEVHYQGKNFAFDQVFTPEQSTEEVYRAVVSPLIDEVLNGLNCTVFAYGQTGTGKTYTIEGLSDKREHFGVIPRAVNQIFDTLSEKTTQYKIKVSFLELYNEEAFDLLGNEITEKVKLRIYGDETFVKIDGLAEETIHSADQIHEILKRGSVKRQTAATILNAHSSRSHSIFTISIFAKDANDPRLLGKLNAVDLAGSENIARSGAQNKYAREAGSINQSLLTLTRVISALLEKSSHIPYRESKLTRILQDSLGGGTRTSMIATVSLAEADISTTLSTLDYASRARHIINKLEYRTHSDLNIHKRCSCKSFEKERDELLERHAKELRQSEFQIRNQVAIEFKEQVEKKEKDWQERLDSSESRNKQELENLRNLLQEQKERHENLIQEQKEQHRNLMQEQKEQYEDLMKQQREQYESLIREQKEQYEAQIKLLSKMVDAKAQEVLSYKQQLDEAEQRVKSSEQEKTLTSPEDSSDSEAPRKQNLKRVRKQAPSKANDYENMTFEGDDEIVQLSTKKKHKKLTGPSKADMDGALTLSGRKKPLTSAAIKFDLSPISPPRRVTRNRTAKKRLNL